MTRDEAAEALERLVEARGPDWVSHTWGIARDRLAGWLEGSEDLPEWMVVVMRAHVAGRGSGDVGCFEDRDHPPEATINWDAAAVAWTDENAQITIHMVDGEGHARPMSMGDLMARKAKISVELNERGEWIGQWKPIYADDHPPEVPEDVTETAWNAVPMPTVGRGEVRIERNRGELLWEAHRLELGLLSDSERNEMIDAAWVEAGRQCGVDDLLRDYGWLPDIMPVSAWEEGANWESLICTLAAVVRCAIEGDE